MTMDSDGRIRVERDGDTVRVVIDNPRKANALGSALLEALRTTFESLGAAPPRAVILTGEGERAFAGGADLAELGSLDVESARAFIGKVHAACNAVRRCPAPVIARLRGAALGAGLELAASCDIRVASDGATFGMPEVRFGIPSVVEAALLPRLLGRGRAAWFLLTGRNLDARTALEWGLVERVVPAADLDAEVEVIGEPVSSFTHRFERAPTGTDFAEGVTVISEGACSACHGTIHSVIYDLEQMNKMEEIRDLFIVVGENAEVPDDLPNTPLIMGTCLRKYEDKGCFVEGCPPNNDKMRAAISEICGI